MLNFAAQMLVIVIFKPIKFNYEEDIFTVIGYFV